LKTGELSRAIAFTTSKHYFGNAPAAHSDYCNCGAAVDLSPPDSHKQHWRCGVPRASWNDANDARYLGGAGQLRARSLLVGGKPDAALAELAQAFRAGEYAAWWYTIESDPLWLPLHNDSRFRSIEADVRRYIDAQRSELEALRRNGLVPRRGVAVASP